MTPPLIGLAGFVAVLALIAVRVPVAVSMGVVGALGFAVLNGWSGTAFVMGSAPFQAIFPYSLSVVPLFILMGVLASHAGLSRRLYEGVYAVVGHRRGGLAMATVGACAAFGAICGSSLATAATMCRIALPEMRRHGYDDRLAAAAIAAGGTLGVLIPPSIILVIYGILTQVSIGKLFAAALLPGVLGTVLYLGAVDVQTRLNPRLGPAGERHPWPVRLRAMRRTFPVALLFFLVIGGIYLGWFSPTEAAAVGAFGTMILAAAGRRLTRRMIADTLGETATMTGMIFLILIGAAVFNYFLESTGLPQFLLAAVKGLGWNRYAVMLLLILFYLALGCFMDSLSMILLTVPFIYPLVQGLGFDGVWFGILVVTVVEMGLITPPVGMNLFVIHGVAGDLAIATIVRGILPFLLADILRLAILVAFPMLALWLPSLMI